MSTFDSRDNREESHSDRVTVTRCPRRETLAQRLDGCSILR